MEQDLWVSFYVFMRIQRHTSSHPVRDCCIQQEPSLLCFWGEASTEHGVILQNGEDGKPQSLLGRGGCAVYFILYENTFSQTVG